MVRPSSASSSSSPSPSPSPSLPPRTTNNTEQTNAARRESLLPVAPPLRPYRVTVSSRFVVLSLLSSILVAFAVGRTARVFLVDRPRKALLAHHQSIFAQSELEVEQSYLDLPTPVISSGKQVPQTSYTEKYFDTSRIKRAKSRWVSPPPNENSLSPKQCKSQGECTERDHDHQSNDESDDGHLPAGQHLLVDIKNVDGDFLKSEKQLAHNMIDLVNQSGLTLLSYHCHRLKSSGVSCAGILLESHISFHTWPSAGVIALDLFTCGPQSLLTAIPHIEKLFAMPKSTSSKPPAMNWAHKFRGFRSQEDFGPDLSDFYVFPVGERLQYKKEVVTIETEYQEIIIYDVVDPRVQSMESYEKSLKQDGSYESLHPELFAPDRLVFLDGIMQSRRNSDAAYHEALVHPSMFAHENPKRVAIIGGGEGATLREVLKHNTIEKVVMIEIDELMVTSSRKYLPGWSDCSDLIGSTPSCFDDPRAEIYYEDAFKWFKDRYLDGTADDSELFDVIIMDALDPQSVGDFTESLYVDQSFYSSIYNALSPRGISVTQVGLSSDLDSPSEQFSTSSDRAALRAGLIAVGFASIRDYSESHCLFDVPWQFLVAFKSFDTREQWFANQAIYNLRIRTRAIQTVSGKSPFHHFDGASMEHYIYPSKASEIVYCRSVPTPPGCDNGHGLDANRANIPVSDLEVKTTSVNEASTLGVFTKVDIPKMSYIGMESRIHGVDIALSTRNVIQQWKNNNNGQYGNTVMGDILNLPQHTYLPSPFFFVKSKCDDLENVDYNDNNMISLEEVSSVESNNYPYNPWSERNSLLFSHGVSVKDIKAGEELLRCE